MFLDGETLKFPLSGGPRYVFGSVAESEGRESFAPREVWKPELETVVARLEKMHFHDFYEPASLGPEIEPIGPSVVYRCPVQPKETFGVPVDGVIAGTGWDEAPVFRK